MPFSILNAQNASFSWVNQFGGLGFDSGLAILTDSSGNVFTVGGFSDTTDFDPGPGISNLVSNGDQDFFILKNDSAGNVIWVKQMGGTGLDQGKDLAFDGNNNLIAIGIFENTVDFDPNNGTMNLTSNGSYDIFIQKLDVNGNLIWVKRIGGSYFDVPESIVIDNANNIYITGNFSRTVDFDPGAGTLNKISNGGTDIFVLKLDSNGNFLWVNQIGGSTLDNGYSIAFDEDQLSLYTTGKFKGTTDFDQGPGTSILTSNGQEDIFIQKLDTSGNLLWVKQIGGTSTDVGNAITLDVTGNIISTGYFEGTVDFDPNIGTFFLTSNGSYDAYVQKLDTYGNLIWARQIGGGNFDQGYSITTDQDENIYTFGTFSSVVDFDPGIGTTNQTSNGSLDIFIQKLDTAGNFLWAKQMGGASYDYGIEIAVGANGDVYTTGGFESTVDFDPGLGTASQTSNGSRDIFIQKLSQIITVSIEENSFQKGLKVYPNPTIGSFSIEFEHPQKELFIRLISVTGQIIENATFLNTNLVQMEINQPNGVYLIEVLNEENRKTVIRMIKE
ncbi:MAG: hypothetical protein ACJAVA_002518 [Flavobacteriaceae bacterium]|jgi:hypothetical protein